MKTLIANSPGDFENLMKSGDVGDLIEVHSLMRVMGNDVVPGKYEIHPTFHGSLEEMKEAIQLGQWPPT